MPPQIRRGLPFHLVDEVDDVLNLALIPPLEPRPVLGSGSGPKPSPKPSPKAFPARPRSKPVSV